MEKIYISKSSFMKGMIICLVILLGILWWIKGEKEEDAVWIETSNMSVLSDEEAMENVTEEKEIEEISEITEEVSVVMLGVHVTGAVAKPDQVLYMPEGSRVGDAVKAAGGANEDADLSQLNLAGYLQDGQRIYVPVQGEKIENIDVTAGENRENLLTNINLATKIELLNLPGIGEAYAERIIQHREENGPFEKIEDIMEVKGIGESKFNDMKDKITVE